MENITLKKIAEVLGLSISTVSRALKNHPDISDATKKRVNEVAEFLDYEPNINAINLRAKKNHVLGLIVPSISVFFYSSFISAVEEECRANDYTLIVLQSANDAETEKKNLSVCRQNRISGLFACLSTNATSMDNYDKFIEADIPLIFFDKVPESNIYNKVCIADEEAARQAAQLLMKKNKRNILSLFGNSSLSITRSRLKAFEETVAKETEALNYVEYCSNTHEAKEITAKHFSKEPYPDAVFCMSDEILIGVMKSLQELKIVIPGKTSVIALSDGFWPKLYTPEITYVETSGFKLGKLAFTRMIDCIENKTTPAELYIKSPLVKGGSL